MAFRLVGLGGLNGELGSFWESGFGVWHSEMGVSELCHFSAPNPNFFSLVPPLRKHSAGVDRSGRGFNPRPAPFNPFNLQPTPFFVPCPPPSVY